MNKKYLTILIHLTGWTVFFVFPLVVMNFTNEPKQMSFREMRPPNESSQILTFLVVHKLLFIIFFYLNLFYLLPALYYKQKKAIYFISILITFFLVVYIPAFLKFQLIPIPEHFIENIPPRPSLKNMDNIFGSLQFLIIWFLSSIILLAQRYRTMEQRNKEMIVQKLDSELNYLKAQINPHFLFNTLNNIYSLSICQSEQTPEAILKLSDIMRYVTQDAEAEKVPLEKEVDYLNNYIALQQLRSNNNLSVTFTVNGQIQDKVIAPLLLINFIENAFKHGVSNHVACFVDICIAIHQYQLTMKVTNTKIEEANLNGTATGSNNTRRRLELQYPEKHSLNVDETKDRYQVTLQLDLS